MPTHLRHGFQFGSCPCGLRLMPPLLEKGNAPGRKSWGEEKGVAGDQIYTTLLITRLETVPSC